VCAAAERTGDGVSDELADILADRRPYPQVPKAQRESDRFRRSGVWIDSGEDHAYMM
jgi:hypothetical protein